MMNAIKDEIEEMRKSIQNVAATIKGIDTSHIIYAKKDKWGYMAVQLSEEVFFAIFFEGGMSVDEKYRDTDCTRVLAVIDGVEFFTLLGQEKDHA